MLNKKQFQLLSNMAALDKKLSQRQLAALCGLSLGTVNKTLPQLEAAGLICDCQITPAGLEALEPYRVKRAVFIAAGFGSRMVPITLNTPKPLVRVKGKRIIDGLLDACVAAGIEEIIVVRGYLSEVFDQLLYQYPMIKFIENPVYNETNNISSVICAADYLQNAYVFEADLLLYNPKLITRYQYSSNYLGVPVDVTDDWCFKTSGGYVSKIAQGGTDCYHMYGVSYWDAKDGARLPEHLKQVYNAPGGKERYWDQVPLECFIKEYQVAVRPCTFDDIVEIDTYNELKRIDPSYI